MLMKRRAAAVALTKKLFAAETAIDEAISRVAELNAEMPVARTAAGLSAIVGQAALAAASTSMTNLVAARGDMVDAHNQLAVVRDQIGLKELGMGSGDMKPPVHQATTKENPLSVVEDEEDAAA